MVDYKQFFGNISFSVPGQSTLDYRQSYTDASNALHS